MIAFSSGITYVDPRYFLEEAMYIACDFARYDLNERAVYIRQCRMRLFRDLGAVLTRSGGSVRYWRGGKILVIADSRSLPRRLGYFAGFCSRSRGLHWDRKKR